MNTNDLTTFWLVMTAGSLSLVLFIIAGNYILNAIKTISLARMPRTGNLLRRKVERNPNIICSLPIHEEARPEQKLW